MRVSVNFLSLSLSHLLYTLACSLARSLAYCLCCRFGVAVAATTAAAAAETTGAAAAALAVLSCLLAAKVLSRSRQSWSAAAVNHDCAASKPRVVRQQLRN